MALIKCPKCNHEISDTSKKCIHCGTSLREKKIIPKKKKIILLVLVSLVIISIIAIAIFKFTQSNNKNDTINNYENSNTTIEKDDTTTNSNDTKENISNNEDIYTILQAFKTVYFMGNLKDFYMTDIEGIKRIIESVKDDDIVKQGGITRKIALSNFVESLKKDLILLGVEE